MRQKFFIDSHKAATGLFVLFLMAVYDQWHNPTAWLYLALHGTYGILWVLKSEFFPDKSWDRRATWQLALITWGGLTLYWIAPWLLTSRGVQASPWYLGLCTSTYAFGVFLHFTSDMQKHMWLRLRPGELLKEGLWARLRNPNYFGELLIYLSFGLLAMHWLPVVVLAAFVLAYWMPNMLRKDASLARYPDFAEYKQRSRLFIPLVF